MKTPSASDNGTLRRGFFTSPAVNVILFHASAANSDPTWATHSATNQPQQRLWRQPRRNRRVPLGRPQVGEIRTSQRAPPYHSHHHHAEQSSQLGGREGVLNQFAVVIPRALLHVNNAMIDTPISCALESETAYLLVT